MPGNNSVNIEAKRPRMSVSRVKLDGYNAWVAYVEQLDAAGPPVYFYFSGSKLPTGESWCSDCVEAMVTRQPIGTYDEFKKFADELQEDSPKVAFFFYSNWCPSCVSTEPIVNAYLSELKENVIFAHVNVGDRDYWKDKNCPFRTDTRTRLLVIPTIIRWKGVQRLEGSQCNKRDLLQMLFTDEED